MAKNVSGTTGSGVVEEGGAASATSLLPPAPPADATADEKDLYWFTHIYQGDRTPQLTFRAIAMGAVLGMLMSVSNLYTILKVGWSFGVAITACVLSFVIWNGFRGLSGGRLSRMSILENNCMQSTASAAGSSTGTTIATAFGALLLIDPAHRHLPWPTVAIFTLLTGLLGVLLAIPMKRQMINHEQLPFPSGIAAATTLRSLYSEGREAVRQAYALVAALVTGMVIGVLNTSEGTLALLDRFFTWMRMHLVNVQLPDQIPADGLAFANGKPMVGAGLESSGLLIAAGMIVGLRVSISMLASASLLYFVIAPWLAGIDAAHAGDTTWVLSIPLVGGGALYHPPRWGLWGGTAVMVFSSLTSLGLQWKTVARSFTLFTRRGPAAATSTDDLSAQMAAIEVPTSWLVVGVVPVAIAMVALQILAFSIHWWAGLLAVALSFILSMVACRATGETDTTPVGAMGKVMQLAFAVFQPRQVVPNLASAGIAANSASSSADLLTDLKSGYLLGANPRKQFLAQFVGVFFGTLAIVPAWYLMIPNAAALEKYPLPATRTWEAVARVLSQGLDALPVSARWAALVGAIIGVLLPVLEKVMPRARKWLPSAMGLGLGWVVFFSNALAFTIGALIAWLWSRIDKGTHDSYNIPIASGLVAGESMIKAFIAMAATALGLFG
jgi:putative OPT family oligopeptide transporter